MKIRAREIFDTAKEELGYGEIGTVTQINIIEKKAVRYINSIYKILFFKLGKTGYKGITSLDDVVELPEDVIHLCFVPGVASKISFAYGDGNQQAYFGSLYNQGLNLINTNSKQITDVLPSDYMND